jgi:hypothetical protein
MLLTMTTATAISVPANPSAGLPALLTASTPPALPTETRRLLPSLCSLADEDVAHRPEMFLALADRVAAAQRELEALAVPADPSGVVAFLAAFAERRGFDLPTPAMLAMDARAVTEAVSADLLPLACQRLWGRFRYRRLPGAAGLRRGRQGGARGPARGRRKGPDRRPEDRDGPDARAPGRRRARAPRPPKGGRAGARGRPASGGGPFRRRNRAA